jgi:hypothetical protein
MKVIFIKIDNIGFDAGPFNIYQSSDSYDTPVLTNVSRQFLLDGVTASVTESSTDVKVLSDAPCDTYLIIPISVCKQYQLDLTGMSGVTFSYVPCGLTSSIDIYIDPLDFFGFVCAVENTVSIVSGNGTFSIFGDCGSGGGETTTTSTTTTTTVAPQYLGLISSTSIEEDITSPGQPNGNPCTLPLTDDVWIQGYPSYNRVFQSDQSTPFQGNNQFWHVKYNIDSVSVSVKIDNSGFITSGISVCEL